MTPCFFELGLIGYGMELLNDFVQDESPGLTITIFNKITESCKSAWLENT